MLIAQWSNAQLLINGQVRDLISQNGVPGRAVQIIAAPNAQSFNYSKTVTTNNQGYFYDTLFMPIGVIKFYISTLDCNQSVHLDSIISSNSTPVNIDICTNGINMCIADYVSYPDTGNFQLVHFYNISSTNTDFYLWNFGDGNYSTAVHPSHYYALGTYQVCLTAHDSITNCNDIQCDSITIVPNMNCVNSFTSQFLGQKKFVFTGTVNNAYPSIFQWEFGDNTTGNGKIIQHQYSQPGVYQVTLSTTSLHPQTMDTCITHTYQSVTVIGAPTASLWGQVFADSSRLDYGKVYLYSVSGVDNHLTLMDSSLIINDDSLNISYYEFTELDYGPYVLYLKPLSNSIFNNSLAPAYSGNTFYWDKAKVLNLNKLSTNFPINLTHLYPIASTYSSALSGKVYEGNKANPGDPVASIPIYLINQNFVPVDFAYSESDGYYEFPNLSEQKYYIYADVINHDIFPSTATIKDASQVLENINIYIGPGAVTGIDGVEISNSFKVFPNPAKEKINIAFYNSTTQSVQFNLVNVLGQIVISRQEVLQESSLQQVFCFDVSGLNAGVYMLQMVTDNQQTSNQKVIISE